MTHISRISPVALLLASTLISVPSFAQSSSSETDIAGADPAAPVRTDRSVIVVTGTAVPDLDLLGGISVVETRELTRDARGQLGDVLVDQPGVSATSFTPGASRPVLRGFQGPRVRVLTDGLGTLDVSNNSVDHAVTVNPLTAQSIEIFRGPAALLFGSAAIGGAVNVVDRRIPRELPENRVRLDALAGYGSAADDRSIGASADAEIDQGFVAHVDGSYLKSGDVRTGGFILSPELRAAQLDIAAEEREEGHLDEAQEAEELASARGHVPNTYTETYSLGGGLSYIGERGTLGFSVGYYDTDYGVPSRPGFAHAHGEEEHEGEDHEHEGEEDHHEHGEEDVSIRLKQWRADLRGTIDVDNSILESIRLRAGYSDYEHIEFEGAEIGTQFFNQGLEARVELVQARKGIWHGTTGAQISTRDFEAIGPEAFVPPNSTTTTGVFTLQELDFDAVEFKLAGRYENVGVRSGAVNVGLDPVGGPVAIDRDFDLFSIAGGVTFPVTPLADIGINVSRVERAPSAEELFSNGPHIATQAFELGNPGFGKETSTGIELFARGEAGPVRFQAAAYHSWFDGFIFEQDIGLERDGLPVFQYFQDDARYYGFEAQAEARLYRRGDVSISADLLGDYVHAEVEDDQAAPRIPPLRLLGGVTAQAGPFNARATVQHVFEQTRIAPFETPTSDFTLVGLSAGWQPFGKDNLTEIVLQANNLFDVSARRHASFTKDYVPLAGRDIRVSLRLAI